MVWRNLYHFVAVLLLAYLLVQGATTLVIGLAVVVGVMGPMAAIGFIAKRVAFSHFEKRIMRLSESRREAVGEGISGTAWFIGLFLCIEVSRSLGLIWPPLENTFLENIDNSTLANFSLLIGVCIFWWVLLLLTSGRSDKGT